MDSRVDALESVPAVDTPESSFLFEAVDLEAPDALFAPASDGRSRSADLVVRPVAEALVTVRMDGRARIRHPEELHVD